MTAKDLVVQLKDGNERYLEATKNDGDISLAVRKDTAENGQHPYAVVVACADSCVVPEHVFMTGLGELFVVRVAGNVIGGTQMGSIEYAVEHLGCKLVVVLGHTGCGAVGAAIAGGAGGYIKTLTDGIRAAIGTETNDLKATCLNVRQSVNVIRSNLHMAADADFVVQGAVYDASDGHVEWLLG
ncbi:MAG: hypothetical protein J1D88_09795 [Treponema sp.]|nr:hypothetical protein [Treponema sp.]